MAEALDVRTDPVEYPTSDGRPVAESDLHYLRLAGAAYGIRKFLAARDDVYVGSNLLVYDEPGNPRRHLSPDVFVAFGVRPGPRDLYKIWEEQPPAFVLEITSKTTRLEDERTKRDRYAEWGVREYFLYDPRAEWLDPPLQGLALDGKRYRSMHPSTLPNGKRGFRSKTLGLCPWLSDAVLRLFDPATGQDLPTPEAEAAARAAAESRAEAAESSALVHQRTLVVRLAKRRFDPATAASLAALIECVDSWDDIARIGEWVVSSVGPAELLARVRVAFPR